MIPKEIAGYGNLPYSFIGVVEDVDDPLTLGRCRVRCFHYHPEDKQLVPTKHLPWAIMLQPVNSAATSGVGIFFPPQLNSWVMGYFADGEDAQYPIIIGTIPRVHRQQQPGQFGNSGAGYSDEQGIYSGASGAGPYAPGVDLPTDSSGSFRNDGTMLTKANSSNWPLKYYSYKACPDGLACKDGQGSLRFHYATARALEQLTDDWGGKKFYLNSAYRTPAYNSRVGGAKYSQHIQGRALDIAYSSIGGKSRENLAKFGQTAVKNGFVGFGLYDTFIHIDTGTGRTWNGASGAWFVNAIKQAGWYPGKKGLSDVRFGSANTATSNTSSTNTQDQQEELQDYNPANEPQAKSSNLTPSQRDTVIRTVYGEAAGEGPEGQAAVANVIKNRSTISGLDPATVSTYRAAGSNYHQFSVWNSGDRAGNLARNLSPNSQAYQDIGRIVDGVWGGSIADNTNGADHYYNPNVANPSWGRTMPTTAVVGNHVFKNGNGRFPGSNGNPGLKSKPFNGNEKGFYDPSNSLPYGDYRGKPSTHPSARGMNANALNPDATTGGSGLGGYVLAGERGTFGEPPDATNPKYGHNNVISSRSGHMIELDDSPNSERLRLTHRSGSSIIMNPKGSVVQRATGKQYIMSSDDTFVGSGGALHMSSAEDVTVRATADLMMHSDGSMQIISGNDLAEIVSGKRDIAAGEVVQIKAGTKVIIEGTGGIDVFTTGDLNIQAEGALNIKGKSVNITADGGDLSVMGKNIYADPDGGDIRFLEGKSKKAEDAQNADIAKPTERVKVNKGSRPNRPNPDINPTPGDSIERYASDSDSREISTGEN